MKSIIGYVIIAAMLVQVQTNHEETFTCSKFHNDTIFDLYGLQMAVEECGPRRIVNHCKCPPNCLRFTKCLIKKLKLVYPDCPKENQCISLHYLTELFRCYANHGKINCHC